MHAIITLLAFLLLPVFARSQENSLLWKITSPSTSNTSYLFGSIHSNDSLLNTFSDAWWEAFLSCHVLAGEVNSTDPAEMMASFEHALMKEKTLAELYKPEEFERIKNYLFAHLDQQSLMVVSRMKPFYIMASIMEAPSGEGPYDQVMDIRLQTVAHNNKMKVVGLESTVEQAKSIESISIEEQAVMLLEFVDAQDPERQKELPAALQDLEGEMKKLQEFYLQQNLDSLSQMMTQFDTSMPAQFSEALLDQRNERFIQNLLPLIEKERVFCAVGAMHLPGESGMIALLRKRGYQIEPVRFTFTASALKKD
ncbi:MAG: TraB/GumN family protein [Flavobacteriales bacterium]|nr:TraB/GumN family protein [Flavobacteriales bacterium]